MSINIERENQLNHIEQKVFWTKSESDKKKFLLELLEDRNTRPPIMIFSNRKVGCDMLCEFLEELRVCCVLSFICSSNVFNSSRWWFCMLAKDRNKENTRLTLSRTANMYVLPSPIPLYLCCLFLSLYRMSWYLPMCWAEVSISSE